VLPITHVPTEPERSVAIPSRVKRHLGLDHDAACIVLDEVNEFVWPGVICIRYPAPSRGCGRWRTGDRTVRRDPQEAPVDPRSAPHAASGLSPGAIT
jgi:hypothetical protein